MAAGTHTADPVTSTGTFLFIIAVAIAVAWRRVHLSTASFYSAIAVAWRAQQCVPSIEGHCRSSQCDGSARATMTGFLELWKRKELPSLMGPLPSTCV